MYTLSLFSADGRKYDSLAGLGGQRGTCVVNNFMCLSDDPYGGTTNILVHEFAHTLHQYGLPHGPGDLWNAVGFCLFVNLNHINVPAQHVQAI